MMPIGSLDEIAALRLQLWNGCGFRPVAVYNHDADHASPGKAPMGNRWQEGARQTPPLTAVARVQPQALNTGILSDGLRAIDVDIDDPAIARQVSAIVFQMLGEAPMRYRGNSARVLILYRAAEGEPPKRALAGRYGKVEALGRGQQFVAFGVHASGSDLLWMPESPADVTADALPAVSEQQIDQLFAAVAPLIEAQEIPRSATGDQATSPRGLAGDPLQVVAALSAIPNAGPADWDGWNRIGMATWAASQGSEFGRAAFHAWSAQHPAYSMSETDARWNHYQSSPPTQIGAGTLFHIARQARPERPPEREQPKPEADKARPMALTYFNDIAPDLEAHDFVQGVLTCTSFAVIYGEPGSGKTFFATDIALCVAAGMTWNNRRVEGGGVIYAALEGQRGFRNRIAAWKMKHDGLEVPVNFAAIQSSVNLLSPDADVLTLIQRIKEAAATLGGPVRLVVIDTLSRALSGGDENSSVDMGKLINNVGLIIQETGATVLMIHHSGKDAARGARGWSGLKGAIDTEIEVTRPEEGPRAAKVVKQKEGEDGAEFKFTLEAVVLGVNQYGEDVTTCTVDYSSSEAYAGASLHRKKLPTAQQRALEVLADLVAGSGQGGHHGMPASAMSVPEKWWRERFYERAMPGAEDETKRKAFRRAADELVKAHLVGMSMGRVWVVAQMKDGT